MERHCGGKQMIKFIKELFFGINSPSLEEIYLSQAVSLADLERRQQQINRGQAPWNNARIEW